MNQTSAWIVFKGLQKQVVYLWEGKDAYYIMLHLIKIGGMAPQTIVMETKEIREKTKEECLENSIRLLSFEDFCNAIHDNGSNKALFPLHVGSKENCPQDLAADYASKGIQVITFDEFCKILQRWNNGKTIFQLMAEI